MRRIRLVVLAAGAVLALTACGSVEAAQDAASDDAGTDAGAGDATAAEDAGGEAPAGPVTLTDARGEELRLDAPAAEVVGLEWGVVENLVSLGVMPVGVADVTGYTNWVQAAPLDDGVEDVGMRGEPSIDALVALDPDLVISTTDLAPNIIEQIEEFVPVLVVRGADAERPIEQMRDNLELTADAVGRGEQAQTLLEELDAALADGAQQIADAGAEGDAFVLADGWMEGSNVSIRMFTPGSLAGAVGEELGLDNAWDAEGDPDYGLAQTDVEGLDGLGDVHFLYYANDQAGGDPFAEGLTGNAIWESLPFVERGDVDRLPDGIWMFGGPRSVEQFVEATVTAVTS
ncbi:ABC transporter substrate-binding protein [Egicoccus sp. AB-alg2]|uniref:ABC transporter substrate-binding protein n=1 Tax=Egicoccus sp. AB-alg2 TaxID=3242693 RepID=UPI00359E7887